MKNSILLAFVACCLWTGSAFAQRGLIIKPATTPVMDPNQDGYVSKTTAGFSNKGFQGYYVKEFEIPMFGIPISPSGEAAADNQVGPACGITDITVDSLGYGAYAVLDNANNLVFRFRIGTNNPSVEAYSILIDTDGKMGVDDPNSTANNPGFEIDITLIKNANKGIYVYNIDGIQSCPTPLRSYGYDTNFQISIADIVTCSNLDYFYDYYVPFADLQTLFGITKSTEMRFVALTNISGTCAMAGKISDVGGVDDTLYGGCNTCAFLELGTSQCPTSLNDLCATCSGFQSGVTPKPTINKPVKAGESTISGTAIPGANIFVDLFSAANVLKQSLTTTAASSGCTACPWSVTFSSPLVSGDIVSAKAKLPFGCSSAGISSGATVEVVVTNVPPVITGALSSLTYNENDLPLKIDGNLTITDPDNTVLNLATVSINTNFISGEDVLTFTPAAGIAGTYNALTGIIQFTGIAPLTTYQALLRSVSYSNTSENPTTLTRTVRMMVNDGLDNSNNYDRQIDVVRVNDAPVAVNDIGSTTEDTPVTLPNIAANDTDVDGTVDASTVDLDPLTVGKQVSVVDAHGTWTVTALGAVTFTPLLNLNGSVTRTYTVNDNLGAVSNAATITINIIAVNDPPVANNDVGTTSEDTPATLANVTANDTDVDGTLNAATVDLDPSTVGIQNSFSNVQGNWSVNAAGAVTYTPALNFNGITAITYKVNDNLGATSNAATITITVTAVNDPPVAVDDNGSTNEDTPVILPNIAANDTDVDGTVDVSTIDLDPLTGGKQTSFSNAQGNWSVDAAGNVSFTPALNFNGVATRTYTVNDNAGATSNAAAITIIVNSVNDAPVANNDSGTTDKDTPVTLAGVTGNDTDVDGTVDASTVDIDPATAGKQTVFSNAQGNWSVNPSGDVTFTPVLGFLGIASINYVVKDNGGALSNQASLSITVTNTIPGGNIIPTANNDMGTTNEDTPVTLNNIIANDTDPDGTIDAGTVDLDPLTAGIQTTFSTAEGLWSVNASGAVTYSPTLNFNGTAVKTYTVRDNLGATSNTATVTITVNAVNDPPVANNDSGITNEDVPITLANIAANDTDVDGTVDPATVDLDPSTGGIQNTFSNIQGNWTVNASADLSYAPALNFSGPASITYTIKDNLGAASNTAVVTVTVNAVNDKPVANNDTGLTNEDTPVTLPNITSNDTDSDGTVDASTVDLDPVTAGKQTSFTNAQGTWSVAASGALTYTPSLNFNGVAQVSYTVNDNSGATSNTAFVTVTVNAVNDAPVANTDSGTTNEDTPITLTNITADDTDVDGTVDASTVDLDLLTAGKQVSFTNAKGTWTVNGAGDLTFVPALNTNGPAVVQYTVSDNLGAVSNTATVTINVNPVNDAPVLKDLAFVTAVNLPVSGNVFDPLDADPDGTALTASPVPHVAPAHGSIIINANGTFTYTPALNYVGIDVVEVEICDNGIPLPPECSAKAIKLTVRPANNPPVIYINGAPGAALNTITLEDTPVVFCFQAVDPDGDNVSFGSVNNLSGGGSLDIYGGIPFCFQFSPSPNFYGTAVWEIQVCDNGIPSLCGKLTATIVVTPVNDAPITRRDSIRVLRKVSYAGNVLTNDSDVEGNAMTVSTTPLQNVLHGQATLQADGSFTYVSDITYRGLDSLVYQVCDDGVPIGCSSGTLIILVEDLPLKVYQGVSPNGDGINDYLRIDGLDYYVNNEIIIIDRYDNIVFQMKGYNNEDKVWRGQANKGGGPTELPDETYFYTISLGDGKPPLKGYVILKRN